MDRHVRLVYSTGGEKPEEEAKPTPARRPKLGVRIENRPGNRIVTILSGLPQGETAVLARELKSLCATGGTFEGTTVELQGDHRTTVTKWLKSRKHGR